MLLFQFGEFVLLGSIFQKIISNYRLCISNFVSLNLTVGEEIHRRALNINKKHCFSFYGVHDAAESCSQRIALKIHSINKFVENRFSVGMDSIVGVGVLICLRWLIHFAVISFLDLRFAHNGNSQSICLSLKTANVY